MGKGSGDGCNCCDVINFKAIPLQESMLPYVSLVSLNSWGHGHEYDTFCSSLTQGATTSTFKFLYLH